MSPPQADWKPLKEDRSWQTWLRETPLRHWLYFALALGFVLVFTYERSQRRETWFPLEAIFKVAMVCVFAYTSSQASRLTRPSRGLTQRLRFRLPEGTRAACPVKMAVLRDDVPIGHDEGIVTFVNGMLSFEGLRTAFALKPTDVVAGEADWSDEALDGPPIKTWLGFQGSRAAWGFHLAEDERYRVYFFPLETRRYPSVYPLLYDWLHERSEAVGQTTLPPLVPLPGYVSPLLQNDRWSMRKLLRR